MLNPNGSHLPALVACVALSDGPVLELGMGEFSTPVLHSLCFRSRRLLSVDSERPALYNFSHLAVEQHEMRLDFGYETLDELARQPWGVVFVDHWPSERRADDALKFLGADYVLVHDAEVPSIGPPIIQRATVCDCHAFLYKRFDPWTLILTRKEIPNLP